jgi:acyl-coenzyme A thioesterase PaaI-like protein
VGSAAGSAAGSATYAGRNATAIERRVAGGSVHPGRVFVCDYTPEPHHQAFPGVLNGGILGTLLDCHSNWCAAMTLMEHHGWDLAMCTVTADFHVRLTAPTPAATPLTVRAWTVEIGGAGERTAKVHAEVWADTARGRKATATCDGTFVAVEEGHPAWHRWG